MVLNENVGEYDWEEKDVMEGIRLFCAGATMKLIVARYYLATK